MKQKKFFYLFYFIPIFTLAYLFWQNAKPVLEMEYKIDGKTPLVSELVPLSRAGDLQKDEKGFYRSINEEPVYFDVRLPRKYNQAEIEVEYYDFPPKADAPGAQNNDIFEVGISRDEARKNFDFITLENKILDNLNWEKIEEGGLVLYQKKQSYKSIGEFLANPSKFNETLVYRANLNPKTENFWAEGTTIFDFPIKERVKFAFYHDGGEINLEFGDKSILVNLYKDGEIMDMKATEDFEEGIYVMEIIGDEDFVLEDGLRIGSPYVVILDSVKIGELKKPATIYLGGSRLLARTESADGLQKLWVGGRATNVDESFEQYKELFEDRNPKTVYIQKGNIELNGNLFFAKPYNLFYPRYEVLYPDIDLSGVNYIFTKYAPPKESEGIKSAKATFNIMNTPTPYNKLRFLLSLPNSEKGELVKIKSIKLKFTGEKFSIKDIFNKLYYTLIEFTG